MFEARAKLAPGYAALAASLFQRNALEPALAAYRRAIRLAPDYPEAKRWRAEIAFVSTEHALTRGVVDLSAYARALQVDPSHRAARDAFERLSGTRAQHARDKQRRWALASLAALSLLAGLLLWRMRSNANNFEFGSREEQSQEQEDSHARTQA